jgi:serine/threonine-protein kinase
MDTARWDLAGNIFERLLGAPQAERSKMLETLCGDDAELKSIVVSMLDSENSALGFEERLEQGGRQIAIGETTSEIAVEQQPEAQIGPWRLVSKLGSGGMGVVWFERADGQFEQRGAEADQARHGFEEVLGASCASARFSRGSIIRTSRIARRRHRRGRSQYFAME